MEGEKKREGERGREGGREEETEEKGERERDREKQRETENTCTHAQVSGWLARDSACPSQGLSFGNQTLTGALSQCELQIKQVGFLKSDNAATAWLWPSSFIKTYPQAESDLWLTSGEGGQEEKVHTGHQGANRKPGLAAALLSCPWTPLGGTLP
jgi:hypothetical protein